MSVLLRTGLQFKCALVLATALLILMPLAPDAICAEDPSARHIDQCGFHPQPNDPVMEMIETGVFATQRLTDQPCPRRSSGSGGREDLERDWTILFYGAADSENMYDPLRDFSDDAFSNGKVDVIFLQDSQTVPGLIWHIEGNGVNTLLEDLGDVNTGVPVTLRDFISYGKENFPANRYLLCMYDHGAGHLGACIDSGGPTTNLLTMEGMRWALEMTGGVDIIAFTAPCLMGAVESVYELRDCVDAYIGSEELHGFASWRNVFDPLCTRLSDSDHMTNDEIAAHIVGIIANLPENIYSFTTLCAVSSARVQPLVERIDELAAYLIDNMATLRDDIETARGETWELSWILYEDYYRVDLISAVEELALACDDTFVGAKCREIIDAFDAAILEEVHGSGQIDVAGLSVYYPAIAEDYNNTYHTTTLDFTDQYRWDEFLRAYNAIDLTGVADLTAVTLNTISSPNPFTRETCISFANPTASAVRLQVFDVAGRHVRTLCSATLSQGPHNLIWDGRDDAGRACPTGAYLYRLETGGIVETSRMVLLR